MDAELDEFICTALKIPVKPLDNDALLDIIKQFFPAAEFCKEEKVIKETGCAYLRLSKTELEENTILITEPTEDKISKFFYNFCVLIAVAINNGTRTFETPRFVE